MLDSSVIVKHIRYMNGFLVLIFGRGAGNDKMVMNR